MEPKWLEWAKQLQSIAQAGLAYSNDPFDIERFETIRNISVEMLSEQTGMDTTSVKELFANETGYATPKVDVRAVVFKDNKILMVKEKSDGFWSLPGGWGDIGLSPSEVAEKEVLEESGMEVETTKLISVLDEKFHPHPPSAYHVYKLFIQCNIIGGKPEADLETSDVDFFAENELPPLSTARNTETQIQEAFQHLHNPDRPVNVD